MSRSISIEALESVAREAGAEIRRIYETNSFAVEMKVDQSPVTEADLAANRIIVRGLKQFGKIPYISEEENFLTINPPPSSYWLIDPLDGTKEFVKRRKSFTVNIALVDQGTPEIAVVYDPIADQLYSAHYGVYRENGFVADSTEEWPLGTVLVTSHSHPEAPLASFIERNSITEHQRVGSSIKFCLVAARHAHIYPRFSPLRAWDTAAGDGVARAAGCVVIDWNTGRPPHYAYDQPWTPAFCVYAKGTAISR